MQHVTMSPTRDPPYDSRSRTLGRPSRKVHCFGQLLLATQTSAGGGELLHDGSDQHVPAGPELQFDLAKAETIPDTANHGDCVVIEFAP
jgi:hypothetical protein